MSTSHKKCLPPGWIKSYSYWLSSSFWFPCVCDDSLPVMLRSINPDDLLGGEEQKITIIIIIIIQEIIQ